jgi:hypothetical protein
LTKLNKTKIMQKFTEFIKQHQGILERNDKDTKQTLFNSLMEAKLKEYGANSIMDLSEEELESFNSYVKTIKEDLSKADVKKVVKSETKELEKKVEDAEKKAEAAENDAEKAKKKAGQDEVTDEKSFREYAEGVLKKAHGDDYDEKIANKVIDGLISKVGKDGDWGQAIGRLTSGLGG